MPGIIGFIGKDLASLRCVLSLEGPAVKDAGEGLGGWGLIYYKAGDILLKSHPFSTTQIEGFLEVLGEAETDTLLGRFESVSSPPPGKWNMQPFRYRGWVAVQQGRVDGFNKIREDIVGAMPDFLGRSLKGTSDAEAVFHLFLSFLYDTGKLDLQKIDPQVVVTALRHSLEFMQRMCLERDARPPALSLLVSNGSMLAGYSHGEGRMGIYEGRGDCERCDAREKCRLYRHSESTRSALVMMFRQLPPALDKKPFSPVQPDSFFVISRDVTVESIPGRITMF
jgi:hypothetical protein